MVRNLRHWLKKVKLAILFRRMQGKKPSAKCVFNLNQLRLFRGKFFILSFSE